MNFTLLQHGENINHNHGIQVTIEDDQWQKWYKEMMRRFKEREGGTYDVDEAGECGVIGMKHLAECLKFLAKRLSPNVLMTGEITGIIEPICKKQ